MALTLPTGARGRALALGMTVLAGAAVWAGAIMPVWSWYDDRTDLLQRQAALARRMASQVASLPALRQRVALLYPGTSATAGVAQADDPGVLLTGATDPLAAATLQQRIDELATAAGVHIGSEEILPGQTEGDLRAISVRLTMSAPFRPLVAFLLAMARSETPMVADEIMMRGPAGKTPEVDPPIDASLTVTSYRPAKADAR
jgi:general secretion pathway protein M